MSETEPLLVIKFEGPAMGPGRIPLSTVLRYLTKMRTAVLRTGNLLWQGQGQSGSGISNADGPLELDLDLVRLTAGSPSAVLHFERSPCLGGHPESDRGVEALRYAVLGLNELLEEAHPGTLPVGFNSAVIRSWCETAVVFGRGVEQVGLSLNLRGGPVSAVMTRAGMGRLKDKLSGPLVHRRMLEGRLQMADFKETGPRCRIHPTLGDPVICTFDEDQSTEVLRHLTKWVRVVGEATEDIVTGRIRSLTVLEIGEVEPKGAHSKQPSMQDQPFGFWEKPSLLQLAEAQGVRPVQNIRSLYGTWPGEPDDGFEELIDDLRHPKAVRE